MRDPNNPYAPAESETPIHRPRKNRKWLLGFVALNFLLIAAPLALAGFAYLMYQIQKASQPSRSVVYDTEFTGFSGSGWQMVGYLLIPNAILLLALWSAKSSNATQTRP